MRVSFNPSHRDSDSWYCEGNIADDLAENIFITDEPDKIVNDILDCAINESSWTNHTTYPIIVTQVEGNLEKGVPMPRW